MMIMIIIIPYYCRLLGSHRVNERQNNVFLFALFHYKLDGFSFVSVNTLHKGDDDDDYDDNNNIKNNNNPSRVLTLMWW